MLYLSNLRKKLLKIVAITTASLMLFSISGCVKKAQIITQNLKTITKPKEGISTVNMMIYADDNININALNEPTPINFLVLQLENDLKFYDASFDELSGNVKSVLSNDYVSHKAYQVIPGKFIPTEELKLNDKTQHIAVVAAYKELDQVLWRTSHKVKNVGKKYAVHVVIKKTGIKMEVKSDD